MFLPAGNKQFKNKCPYTGRDYATNDITFFPVLSSMLFIFLLEMFFYDNVPLYLVWHGGDHTRYAHPHDGK